MLTALGRGAEAVDAYLQARGQHAALGFAPAAESVERVERKLRAALDGERNEADLRR